MSFVLSCKKLFFLSFGKLYNYLSPKKYMNAYVKYLKQLGINIIGTPNYISSDVQFDSHYYNYITIGDGTVISKEVMFLTHDYSIARGLEAVYSKQWDESNTPHFVKKISIGKNCFIGARCVILPGTTIGDNCILGAGSVVRGNIPDDSVAVGNPAAVAAKTTDWARRHIEKGDIVNYVKKEDRDTNIS